jgi:transcriptional regulator with XRE-family HTH domain
VASGFPITENPNLPPVGRERQRTAFGQRVRDARLLAGLTQHELAQRVGISQSTLGEAETSAQGSAYTPQIARACNVSAEWLATGEGEPRPELDADREKLSAEAVQLGLRYDTLSPAVRAIWRTMVDAAAQAWEAQQTPTADSEASRGKHQPYSSPQLSNGKMPDAVQTNSPEMDDLFLVRTGGKKNAVGEPGAVPKSGHGARGKKTVGSGGKR